VSAEAPAPPEAVPAEEAAAPVVRPSLYRRWMSPEGYLGIHLAIGFLVTVLGVVGFALIADEVFETTTLMHADQRAQEIARAVLSPRLSFAMRLTTMLGDPPNVLWMSLVVVLWLLKHHSRRRLYAFLATMVGGNVLNQLLKLWFHRARPEGALAVAHGYSFPSGHSMGSMLFWASLAYVVIFSLKQHPLVRGALGALCLVFPLLIGASRIFFGVHYFSDVVAGYAAALAWMGVCLSGIEGWMRWRRWRSAGGR
jgi:membrane-associated phospholipid phosphatase